MSRISRPALALLAVFQIFVDGCRSDPNRPQSGSNLRGKKSTAYFVSIDGLQPQLLYTLIQEGHLQGERGFRWLLTDSMRSSKARPVMTSLTAASHASIITCTPPSRHGIVANGYLQDGKKVNGFDQEFTAEPLWRGAAAQGRRVLTLGYVGTDGTTISRQADYGLAYPLDSLMGRSQSLAWTRSELANANGWVLPAEFAPSAERETLKEAQFTVTLNPKTGETRTVDVLVRSGATPDNVHLYFATGKNLVTSQVAHLSPSQSLVQSVDLFFKEESLSSTLRGVKRRVIVSALPTDAGKIALYVSKASYNQAYPTSFRQELDDRNLVWPDYGIKEGQISLANWVEAQATVDRFLVDVANQMVPDNDIDVVLFYQPLIDALGHKMQARLPQAFSSKNSDEVTQAFVRAFTIVDDNLSRLVGAPKDLGPVFVMGDHSMDAVRKVVNVAQFLPRGHEDKVEVFSSGDLLLVYPLFSNPDRNQALQTALAVGEELRAKLAETQFEGAPVLGFARKVTDYATAPGDDIEKEWQYGQAAWAFAGASGFWYQYQPLKPEPYLDPTALGMHGKSQMASDMATMFIAKGPGIPSVDIGDMSLLDAVPTFAAATHMAPPKDCVGKSLLEQHGR